MQGLNEKCRKFLANPKVNPVNGLPISPKSITYKELVKECGRPPATIDPNAVFAGKIVPTPGKGAPVTITTTTTTVTTPASPPKVVPPMRIASPPKVVPPMRIASPPKIKPVAPTPTQIPTPVVKELLFPGRGIQGDKINLIYKPILHKDIQPNKVQFYTRYNVDQLLTLLNASNILVSRETPIEKLQWLAAWSAEIDPPYGYVTVLNPTNTEIDIYRISFTEKEISDLSQFRTGHTDMALGRLTYFDRHQRSILKRSVYIYNNEDDKFYVSDLSEAVYPVYSGLTIRQKGLIASFQRDTVEDLLANELRPRSDIPICYRQDGMMDLIKLNHQLEYNTYNSLTDNQLIQMAYNRKLPYFVPRDKLILYMFFYDKALVEQTLLYNNIINLTAENTPTLPLPAPVTPPRRGNAEAIAFGVRVAERDNNRNRRGRQEVGAITQAMANVFLNTNLYTNLDEYGYGDVQNPSQEDFNFVALPDASEYFSDVIRIASEVYPPFELIIEACKQFNLFPMAANRALYPGFFREASVYEICHLYSKSPRGELAKIFITMFNNTTSQDMEDMFYTKTERDKLAPILAYMSERGYTRNYFGFMRIEHPLVMMKQKDEFDPKDLDNLPYYYTWLMEESRKKVINNYAYKVSNAMIIKDHTVTVTETLDENGNPVQTTEPYGHWPPMSLRQLGPLKRHIRRYLQEKVFDQEEKLRRRNLAYTDDIVDDKIIKYLIPIGKYLPTNYFCMVYAELAKRNLIK